LAEPNRQQPEPPDASPLTLLGLDAAQDAVYRLLVDHPDSDAAGLAPAGAARDSVRRDLEALVARGLAAVVRDESGERYRASPPILALGPLLESRRAALHRVEHLLTDLAERHRTAQARDAAAPVERVSGAAAIRRRMADLEQRAAGEIRALIPSARPGSAITFPDNLLEVERDLLRRGVLLRAVVERACLEDAGTARSLGAAAARGQQVCVVDELPAKLLIADRDVALLSLEPEGGEDGEPAAVVVHRGGLLTALIALFEQYDEKGWRLRPDGPAETGDEPEPEGESGPGPLDAVDRRIVALLHVGLTDAAIARQLGMGHRTVQRRLQRLMESVGAATRFQLGWHAAVSGWLGRQVTTTRS
jgi:hypothetical protein